MRFKPKLTTAPKVHFKRFGVCTGRNWQRKDMLFTDDKALVTCGNCKRYITRTRFTN